MISNRWYGIVIDVALRFDTKGPKVEPLRAPPRIYRPCHRVEGRHSVRYALFGAHWIVKGHWCWRRYRWILEDLFYSLGWMEGDHPDAPTYASLRWGNPLKILEGRVERIRAAAADARDYAVARAREEGARIGSQLTAIQLEELRKVVSDVAYARAGYEAHGRTFAALQEISFLTDLEGEVIEYSDVVAAVKRIVDRVKELEQSRGAQVPT